MLDAALVLRTERLIDRPAHPPARPPKTYPRPLKRRAHSPHPCTGCAVATNNRRGGPDGDGVACLPFARMGGLTRQYRGDHVGPFRLHRTAAATSPAGRRRSSPSWMVRWTQIRPAQRAERVSGAWARFFSPIHFRRTTGTEANLAPCRSFELCGTLKANPEAHGRPAFRHDLLKQNRPRLLGAGQNRSGAAISDCRAECLRSARCAGT